MSLLACGINYQTAPLAIREKTVFSPEFMSEPLCDLAQKTGVGEAAILSTCNRTELYCLSETPAPIINWLHSHRNLLPGQLDPYIYIHQGEAAVKHLLRVASGLDSMVLGESQILGQVKTAFSLAKAAGTLGTCLHRLFEYVFSTAKQVRSETTIGAHPISIAYAAVQLAKRIFADFTQIGVLLIGAGETVALAARHLQSAGVTRIWIANRTFAHAEKLALAIKAQAIPLNAIAEYLPQADMVIAATNSALPILGKGAVERAIKARKRRLMFMVDLAVPRNIEPEIANLEDVYLYTLDDLQNIIQQNHQHRQTAAVQAEAIIDRQAAYFINQLKSLAVVPVITAYRDKANKWRDEELSKAQQLLRAGILPEEVLTRLAHSLTNKLIHTPSKQLREATYVNHEDRLNWAKELLGVKST